MFFHLRSALLTPKLFIRFLEPLMEKTTMRIGVASCCLAIALLFTGALARATTLSPQIKQGAVFVYSGTVGTTKSRTLHVTYKVTVEDVSGDGYRAKLDVSQTAHKPYQEEITSDRTGWHVEGQPEQPHDLLGIDPATLCGLPTSPALGLHWTCSVNKTGKIWPPGTVNAAITSMSGGGNEFTITATGSGLPLPDDELDKDTGQMVHTVSTTTWKTVAVFRDSLLQDEVTTVHDDFQVGGQTLPVVMTIHLTRQ
jgi:hypothetical protein